MTWMRKDRLVRLLGGPLFSLLAATAAAQENERVTLTFDEPMTAMVNARAWDQTHHEWDAGQGGELFFDAVHRFLLVRFPGSAEAVHAALAEGMRVESARLELRWKGQEFMRVAGGYGWRSYPYQGKEPPEWHASVSALRRPWIDDPEVGPTWNAYLKGAGHWRLGGARDTVYDRYPGILDKVLLSENRPAAEAEVTALLRETRYGADLETRLRNLEERGFLLSKAEIANPEYGEPGLSTSIARLMVESPRLRVTLVPGAQTVGDLPAAVDAQALAQRLREAGGDGLPGTAIPENLPELARAVRTRRRGDMPDWMWERVQEIAALPPSWGTEHGYDWFSRAVRELESGDRTRYEAEIQRLLSVPPGYGSGHQHIEYILPVIEYADLLPEVVRYHLQTGFEARWQRPLRPDKVFSQGKVLGIGTLNHMAQARPKALLGAETFGDTELAAMAAEGLAGLNRWMIWSDGFSQEHGDSYYRGITLAPLQAGARYSRDPLMRLKLALAVEKLLLEDILTYHPGLRRRVSRISRRMGDNFAMALLLHQDVAEAALHMLSRHGVMIGIDAPGTPQEGRGLTPPRQHGMPVYNLHASPPSRVAMVAPWGREWECHNVEDKPLPFRSVFSSYVMGRVTEPIHAMTYMGRHYALASEEVYTSATVPLLASWKRVEQPVERLEDYAALVIQGRLNEQPPDAREKTPFGILQHNNKLIYAVKTHERRFLEEGDRNLPPVNEEGLRSFKVQVSIFAYGPETGREVWVNDRQVEEFPARARQGDVIAIRDGVSYIGLIALPGTDLGRRDEVVIRQEHPLLAIDSYLLQSEEALPFTEENWKRLADARAGWIVEMGDAAEHASFAAFRQHLQQARADERWEPETRVWHLAYRSGGDTMELGFRTDWEREMLWHRQYNPSTVFAYQRVNGGAPWPGREIDMDSPFAQLGTAARLEKGGAVLETRGGQTSLLRIEPATGTYQGVNPFIDPTPFQLTTPEGAVVKSEGPIGLARVVIRPGENRLWVEHVLPPPEGDRAEEKLRAENAGYANRRYFPLGNDPGIARRESARALLVCGLNADPKVEFNGRPLPGPFPQFTAQGRTWRRIALPDRLSAAGPGESGREGAGF